MGSPAKVVRELTDNEVAAIEDNAARYVEYAQAHRLKQEQA
jgi:carbonic anhydrase/acetyltransferase-like protein (isoleucine patch superfamily)